MINNLYETLFDDNQLDLTLDNARVQWAGQTVNLWSQDMKKHLANITACEQTVSRIKRWCVKNNYRCAQIANGKVQI